MPGIDGVIRDLACNNNAGIVEDVVNAAELLNRLGHKFTDSSKVAHIEMLGGKRGSPSHGICAAAASASPKVDVREDDLAAHAAQEPRRLLSRSRTPRRSLLRPHRRMCGDRLSFVFPLPPNETEISHGRVLWQTL